MSALLDDSEKERVRYHMGYLNVQPAPSIAFGIPIPVQTLFLLEQSMNNIATPSAADRVRKLIQIMDDIECKMVAAQDYLVASRLEDIELRENHPELLEREYCRWAARLSDELGAPLYPGAVKFRSIFQGGIAGSIPVRH